MATTKPKGNAFVQRVTDAANKAVKELGIDNKDIDLIIRVKIEDSIHYNHHEDED